MAFEMEIREREWKEERAKRERGESEEREERARRERGESEERARREREEKEERQTDAGPHTHTHYEPERGFYMGRKGGGREIAAVHGVCVHGPTLGTGGPLQRVPGTLFPTNKAVYGGGESSRRGFQTAHQHGIIECYVIRAPEFRENGMSRRAVVQLTPDKREPDKWDSFPETKVPFSYTESSG